MRILGIDPGLRNTGFGVIEIINHIPIYITSGVISSNASDSLSQRLKTILLGLQNIIQEFKPDLSCIEKVFVNINPSSTLLLGQARGVAIAACVLADLEVFEYTALQVKQAVVGYGHADKLQVQAMVKYLLHLDGSPSRDAADALACALAHVQYSKMQKILAFSRVKAGRSSN
jgi:crossover junction endodeoxyribonuclease RuvC